MSCPTCRNGNLVHIGLEISSSMVTMHSCSVCETRWWDQDGQVIGLGNVLGLVPQRKPVPA